MAGLGRGKVPVPVRIIGVNAVGEERANWLVADVTDLAWLQDTEAVSAWTRWNVKERDVVILDRHGVVFRIYNLASRGSAKTQAYAKLKRMLKDAAAAP